MWISNNVAFLDMRHLLWCSSNEREYKELYSAFASVLAKGDECDAFPVRGHRGISG